MTGRPANPLRSPLNRRRPEAVMLVDLTTTLSRPDNLPRIGPLDAQHMDARAGAVRSDSPSACSCHPPGVRNVDLAIADWDMLFSAVKARLRGAARASPPSTLPAEAERADARLRAEVIECVLALDQLHATLVHEVGRWPRIEREALGAPFALAADNDSGSDTLTQERP
jgi:hypothetical protein